MTTVTVRIPTPLRSLTEGVDELRIAGSTVGDVLATLGASHEGALQRILGPDGEVRQFVNSYRGSEEVRVLQGMSTPVAEGDVVSIIPAVAGGAQ